MELTEALQTINAFLPAGLKLAIVQEADLEFLEVNARYMERKMFLQLVENVKKDQFLSSVPFCYLDHGKYRVLSGNHRLKAGIAAGLTHFLILYTDRPMPEQEQISRQLSHNAIEGKDDPVILKTLWDKIQDATLKEYVGLDDKLLKELETMKYETLTPPQFRSVTVPLVFLDGEVEFLDIALAELGNAKASSGVEEIYVVPEVAYQHFLTVMDKIETRYNIKNITTKFLKMLSIVHEHVAQEEAEAAS